MKKKDNVKKKLVKKQDKIWEFSLIFGTNKDIVQVYNNKDIELLYQNLVDITLESGWYIS